MASDLTQDEIAAYRDAFTAFEIEGKGVKIEDLWKLFEGMGRRLNIIQLRKILKTLKDPHYMEFMELIKNVRRIDLYKQNQKWIDSFRVFDPERSGFIPAQTLRDILFEHSLTYTEINDVMQVAEVKNGQVDYMKIILRMS